MAESSLPADRDQFGRGPDPGSVWCDLCPRGTQAAVKSCLSCVASYCVTHLKPHYETPALRSHLLTETTGPLQETVCPLHKEPLKVYCRTDQRCVCLLCMIDEHKGHDTISALAEYDKTQDALCTARENSRERIKVRENKLQELRLEENVLLQAARTSVAECEAVFADIIQSAERQCVMVKELIRREETTAVDRGKRVQETTEQEITELRKRDAELQILRQTSDHVRFLQRWRCLSVPPALCDVSHASGDPRVVFAHVSRAVNELRNQLATHCQAEFRKMSEKVSRVNEGAHPSQRHRTRAEEPLSTATFQADLQELRSGETRSGCGHPAIKMRIVESLREPRTREELLRYACQLTLDSDTANAMLLLSAGNREATRVKERQTFANNSERFDNKCQVLCREALSGRRFYWEAKVNGNKAEIAVAYKGMDRKGTNRSSSFGGNDKSWSLDCMKGRYSVCHNDSGTQLSVPYFSKVGVYLDHPAGKLSFYGLSDNITLLHRVDTVFTEPVYAGFWIGEQCSVKLLALGRQPDAPHLTVR